MGEVALFPEIRHFLACHDCGEAEWSIYWPKDEQKNWYIECVECGSQFKKSILPHKETDL